MTRATPVSVLVVIAFIAAVTLYASPTAASEPAGPSTDRGAAQDAQIHCVAQAYPIGQSPAVPAPLVCFDTFGAAIAFATGGAVQLPDVTSRRLSQAELTPPDGTLAPTSTVIGIDWWDAFMSGSTLTTSENFDPNGCYNGGVYVVDSIQTGWDNQISSAVGYQGCDYFYHYDLQSQGGVRIQCVCEEMFAMNDHTSSEKFGGTPLP